MDIRTRKLAPQYHKQDWRSKAAGNAANYRYTREFILKNYQNLMQPQFKCMDQIQDVLLNSPSPPLLTAIFPFSHELGEEPNSRKFPVREKKSEQMPEWYEDEEPKEVIPKPIAKSEVAEKIQSKDEAPAEIKLVLTSSLVKNLSQPKNVEEDDFEERFTKIDLQVEEKLKNIQADDDYEAPDWDEPTKEEFTFEPIKVVKPNGPVYDLNLLRYHFAIGNPFAQTLIDFGVPFGNNAITFNLGSKPFEKIWHYKDLEGQIHGPFSTLEMFAWTIRNCFPPDLEISIGNSMYFVPMNIFNTVPQIPESTFYPNQKQGSKEPKTLQEIESQQHINVGKNQNIKNDHKRVSKPNESATLDLKNMLGINKKNK